MLGQELATALQLLQRWVENPEGDDDINIKDTEKLQVFAKKIRGALRDVWKDPPTDVFNIGYVCPFLCFPSQYMEYLFQITRGS